MATLPLHATGIARPAPDKSREVRGLTEVISRKRGVMSHRHFCIVGFHGWDCEGKALRSGDREPSVCLCSACGLPLEEGDHSKCEDFGEVVTCPEHRDEERRRFLEMKPRIAARFKRLKAAWDERHGSTPESDRLFEKLMKNLDSKS